MKKNLAFAAAFALFASTQAFAIAGIGAHYVMNTGSLESSTGTVASNLITVNQESASGLQGLGFKLWIDFLPFVDIEGTFNVAAVRYRTFLKIGSNEPKSLEYAPEAPYNMVFDKASPIYGVFSGDVSITYPFELPIIRPYLGAGISPYMASIPIVNADFISKLNLDPTASVDDIGDSVSRALKDADYKTGIGGHIIAGLRIKLTVIPAALYANGKYYFGGNLPKQFSNGFVFELGGGLAL